MGTKVDGSSPTGPCVQRDVSLIPIILLKTGGNADWFTRKHQGYKNPEQFKHQSQFGGKTPGVDLILLVWHCLHSERLSEGGD